MAAAPSDATIVEFARAYVAGDCKVPLSSVTDEGLQTYLANALIRLRLMRKKEILPRDQMAKIWFDYLAIQCPTSDVAQAWKRRQQMQRVEVEALRISAPVGPVVSCHKPAAVASKSHHRIDDEEEEKEEEEEEEDDIANHQIYAHVLYSGAPTDVLLNAGVGARCRWLYGGRSEPVATKAIAAPRRSIHAGIDDFFN